MNTNQIIDMIMRLFVRKAVSKGMNAGINRIAGGGKAPSEMTAKERQAAKSGKQSAKRAKQGMKMARRIGRL